MVTRSVSIKDDRALGAQAAGSPAFRNDWEIDVSSRNLARLSHQLVAGTLVLLITIATCTGADAADYKQKKTDPARCELTFTDVMWSSLYRTWLASTPYLMEDGWQEKLFVRAPPDCQETMREIDAMFALVPMRPTKQPAIDREYDYPEAGMEPVLGLKIVDIDAVRLLVGVVLHEALIAAMHFKNKLKRARPWQLNPAIKPSIAFPPHPSYPSGHATQATAVAMALSRIAPDCREEFMRAAHIVGTNREVAGVHYRSDTAAGERLGTQVMALLVPKPRYQELEADARQALKGKSRCLK